MEVCGPAQLEYPFLSCILPRPAPHRTPQLTRIPSKRDEVYSLVMARGGRGRANGDSLPSFMRGWGKYYAEDDSAPLRRRTAIPCANCFTRRVELQQSLPSLVLVRRVAHPRGPCVPRANPCATARHPGTPASPPHPCRAVAAAPLWPAVPCNASRTGPSRASSPSPRRWRPRWSFWARERWLP